MNNVNDISRNLHRLVFFMDKVAGELLEKHFHLTFSQFRMLLVLERRGAVCQADIAQYHDLTPAAVSRQVDLLMKKKLITQKANVKNRRQHVLMLSPAGKQLVQKSIQLLDRVFSEMYATLSKPEQNKVAVSLEKLVEHSHKKGVSYFCDEH
jgi:DNA-binding MarR family transcriptional regulator